MNRSAIFVIVVLGAQVVYVSGAITCFSCGPGEGQDSLKVNENGTCTIDGNSEFCEDSDMCVKTWRKPVDGDSKVAIEWGCFDRSKGDNENITVTWTEECFTETKSVENEHYEETLCYCSENLCNAANTIDSGNILTLYITCFFIASLFLY